MIWKKRKDGSRVCGCLTVEPSRCLPGWWEWTCEIELDGVGVVYKWGHEPTEAKAKRAAERYLRKIHKAITKTLEGK